MNVPHLSDKRPDIIQPAPLFTDLEKPDSLLVFPARPNLPFSASAQPTAFGKTNLQSNVDLLRKKYNIT